MELTDLLHATNSIPLNVRKMMQEQYLIAVGVGGGPVAQLSSRSIGGAGSPHTSVGPTNWSSKVGLPSGSSLTQLHCTEVGLAHCTELDQHEQHSTC